MTLRDQVALITGASRGLGLAIGRALGAEGARIACMARPGDDLDAAVAALSGAGVAAMPAPADVTISAEVARAVAAVADAWGRLDMLVLNAGTWQGASISETDEAMWDRLLDLNLKGAFLTLKHALPAMTGSGTIVGIGSLGAWAGQPNAAAYAASKWGLRGLLESVALEVKPRRIRVSLVHPHNMNSSGAPNAGGEARDRSIEVAEVASLVAWICSAPSHVAVGNVTIWPLAAAVRAG